MKRKVKDPWKRQHGNPWNITPAMQKVLDAIIAVGSPKGAAYELNISIRTLDCLFGEAKKRMGLRTRLHALLEWDRYKYDRQLQAIAKEEGIQ